MMQPMGRRTLYGERNNLISAQTEINEPIPTGKNNICHFLNHTNRKKLIDEYKFLTNRINEITKILADQDIDVKNI